jgi:hypothetical protein
MKRRESKYFCISDIRYSVSFKYHLQIILNRELFKVRDLVEIEDLIEYFGGKCEEGSSSKLLYIINADFFKTQEQAEYFKEIFLAEYGEK